jgi:flagellar motor switch protein FliG
MPMDGLEKVALLLKGLGQEATAAILSQLGPNQAERVRARMGALTEGPEQQQALRQVLRDIADAFPEEAGHKSAGTRPTDARKEQPATAKSDPAARGGSANVNILIDENTGSEEEGAVEEPLPGDALEAIQQLPPAVLAQAMQGENPRTVSLVLNHLDTACAGEVYKALTVDMRRDVSLHFTSQALPPLEVLRRIANGIVQKCRALSQTPPLTDQADRIKKMAELIRLLAREERTQLLAALEQKDAPIAQKVKDLLYQFEDLLQLEKTSVQMLLGELDTKTLATAMKGTTPAIQHRILTNLSKRAQDALQEEIELMGSVPKAKVEQARTAVAEVIRRLDERGELAMTE